MISLPALHTQHHVEGDRDADSRTTFTFPSKSHRRTVATSEGPVPCPKIPITFRRHSHDRFLMRGDGGDRMEYTNKGHILHL